MSDCSLSFRAHAFSRPTLFDVTVSRPNDRGACPSLAKIVFATALWGLLGLVPALGQPNPNAQTAEPRPAEDPVSPVGSADPDAHTDASRSDARRAHSSSPLPDSTAPPNETPGRAAAEGNAPSVGVAPGGGGFYLRQDEFELRLLGYIQAMGSVFDTPLGAPNDFSLRRARLDVMAQFYDDFQFFLELDGAPDDRSSLVVARLDWDIVGDRLKMRVGKFVTQFSTENARSSRSIDTVERYLALNSLFLLPALDTQYGVMLHGRAGAEKRLGWSVGVYNGNGSASANVRDNNDSKEVQAKLRYRIQEGLRTSVSFNFSRENRQSLSLVDVGFNRFVSVPVQGDRYGIGGDVSWKHGRWRLRAEGVGFRFDAVNQSSVGLYGGFIQPSVFFTGTHDNGVEGLLRLETSRLDADTGAEGDVLYAATAGVNWFVNPNVRLQVNPGVTYFNGPSKEQGVDESQLFPSLLTELQFKF